MHDDVYIYFAQIPGTVNEAIAPCEGGYNITIDPRQSDDGIVRSYLHAIGHIEGVDFEKEDVQKIETEAHRKAT